MRAHWHSRGLMLPLGRVLRARLAARRDDSEEGMAILLVLMCIMVATELSVLALGLVIAEQSPTLLQRKSNRAIEAADIRLLAPELAAGITR